MAEMRRQKQLREDRRRQDNLLGQKQLREERKRQDNLLGRRKQPREERRRQDILLPPAQFVPAARRDAVQQKVSAPFAREPRALLGDKRARAHLKKHRERVRAEAMAQAMRRQHRRPRH